MSLTIDILGASDLGFPRVSGDEPRPPIGAIDANTFSPRERG